MYKLHCLFTILLIINKTFFACFKVAGNGSVFSLFLNRCFSLVGFVQDIIVICVYFSVVLLSSIFYYLVSYFFSLSSFSGACFDISLSLLFSLLVINSCTQESGLQRAYCFSIHESVIDRNDPFQLASAVRSTSNNNTTHTLVVMVTVEHLK